MQCLRALHQESAVAQQEGVSPARMSRPDAAQRPQHHPIPACGGRGHSEVTAKSQPYALMLARPRHLTQPYAGGPSLLLCVWVLELSQGSSDSG